MTREEQRKRLGRRRPVTIQDIGDALPPNVAVLPRRVRHYATWADLIASYEPRPVEPGKVLAFAATASAGAVAPARRLEGGPIRPR